MNDLEIYDAEAENHLSLRNRFQVIFENLSQAAAFFSHQDGQLCVYNHAFIKLTGYSQAELNQKRFSDFVYPADLPIVSRRLKKIVRKQAKHDTFEIRALNKDQQIYFVEITILPHYHRRRLEGAEVFVRDITERKNYEAALLRQNNELKVLNTIAEVIAKTLSLEEILENSLEVILKTLDFQAGAIAIYDDMAQKFTRFIRYGEFKSALEKFVEAELNKLVKNPTGLAQSVLTFNVTTEQTSQINGMGKLLSRCGYQSGAIVLLRSKDKTRGVLFLWRKNTTDFNRSDMKLLISIGGQVGMAIENSWLYEQTDLKLQARISELAALNAISNAVSQTIELEERLNITLTNILKVLQLEQGSIYIVDDFSKVAHLKANQGLPEEVIQQAQVLDLKPADIQYIYQDKIVVDSPFNSFWKKIYEAPVFSSSISRVLTIQLRAKEKLLGFCVLLLKPKRKLSIDELRLLESIGLQIGVAIENSKLYEEAQIRQKELQEMNKELENFIYLISHDLKTPVISIQGLVDIFLEELERPLLETEQKYFRAIQECANRMESLIQDLLEFSRLGQAPLNLESTDINEILNEIRQEFQFNLEHYQVNLKYNGKLPTIYCDPFRFKLALANLIDNAIKYSRTEVDSYVNVSYIEQKNDWLFCVSDNGLGIDPKYHERIFNLFERLTRFPPGSGLGLAMVQRIVRLHGGSIWVESKLGEGSKFFLTVPKV